MSDRDDETRWLHPGDRPDQRPDGDPRDGHGGDFDTRDLDTDDLDTDDLDGPESDRDDPARDPLTSPADLAAVQADDELLDLVGAAGPRAVPSDEPLAAVLLQWRREVEADPVDELVDTDTALALVAGPQRRRRPRRNNPVLMPFAAAAALAVIAFSGVGLAAKSAQPEDRLWGVTQVLYPEYARVTSFEQNLQEARTALDQGREADAEVALDRAEQDLGAVVQGNEHPELAEQYSQLQQQLGGQWPGRPDEPVAPPVTSSSSQPPASSADQRPPDTSAPAEPDAPAPTTAPSDPGDPTSQPEPSPGTSTPMADSPSTGGQTSPSPSARTEPEPEESAESGTAAESDTGADPQADTGASAPTT